MGVLLSRVLHRAATPARRRAALEAWRQRAAASHGGAARRARADAALRTRALRLGFRHWGGKQRAAALRGAREAASVARGLRGEIGELQARVERLQRGKAEGKALLAKADGAALQELRHQQLVTSEGLVATRRQLEQATQLYPSPVSASQPVPLRHVLVGHSTLKQACWLLSPSAE